MDSVGSFRRRIGGRRRAYSMPEKYGFDEPDSSTGFDPFEMFNAYSSSVYPPDPMMQMQMQFQTQILSIFQSMAKQIEQMQATISKPQGELGKAQKTPEPPAQTKVEAPKVEEQAKDREKEIRERLAELEKQGVNKWAKLKAVGKIIGGGLTEFTGWVGYGVAGAAALGGLVALVPTAGAGTAAGFGLAAGIGAASGTLHKVGEKIGHSGRAQWGLAKERSSLLKELKGMEEAKKKKPARTPGLGIGLENE